jgi:hypothetical protein
VKKPVLRPALLQQEQDIPKLEAEALVIPKMIVPRAEQERQELIARSITDSLHVLDVRVSYDMNGGRSLN